MQMPPFVPGGPVDGVREKGPAVPVRAAATVVLLRPDGATYLFRRRSTLIFAAGMAVFPGGRCEAADTELAATIAGATPAHVAAVRETFEECGVLLTSAELDQQVLAEQRERLHGGVPFREVLADLGVCLEPGLLHPWSRWITPAGEVRRYDTMFFIAALPPCQDVAELDSEGEEGLWIQPNEALRRHDASELAMLPPTRVTLGEVAGLSIAEAFAVRRNLDPVLPTLTRDADGISVHVELPTHLARESGPGAHDE